MKKYSFLAGAMLLFAACGEKANPEDKTKTEVTSSTTTEQPVSQTGMLKDPVCGMEKDSTWTEHIVNGTDTSWFCSPHCKETFAKNPEKYLKKKEEIKG